MLWDEVAARCQAASLSPGNHSLCPSVTYRCYHLPRGEQSWRLRCKGEKLGSRQTEQPTGGSGQGTGGKCEHSQVATGRGRLWGRGWGWLIPATILMI